MIERARRLRLDEGALALLLLCAVAALARSRAEPLGWLAVVPVIVALAFRIVRAPALLGWAIERATWLALGLVAAVVLNWLVSPAGQGEPAPTLSAAAAYGLALLAALLLSGRALWPPARAALPAALGILVIAASQAGASMRVTVGLCAIAAVAPLAASGRGSGAAARIAGLAAFGLAAVAAAASIAWLLPWAQPRVLQAAAKFTFPDAETGFSLETRLGDVEELRLSPRVVLRVWTDRPQNLRGAVATAFDGRSWHSPYPGTSTPVPPAEPAMDPLLTPIEDVEGTTFQVSRPAPGIPLVATRILQVAPLSGTLLAPAGVVVVRGPQGRLVVDGNRILNPPASPGKVYGVLNAPGPQAGSEDPEMLGVPVDTDARIRELAARLAAGLTSPEARVARTIAFLQSEYPYSLRMGAFRSRQPVAEFLFEKRQGWCQYFASAGALLLRLEGVPTRFVSGFRLRTGLLRGGHYVVREADAHAWIEVWLPEKGWVEADPTPTAAYEAAHGGLDEGWLAETWERVKGLASRLWGAAWRAVPALLWQELRALLREPAVRASSILGGGALLLLLLVTAWRRRQPKHATLARASDAAPDLARLLARLDRAWARRGVPRPPARGPLEHARQIEDARVPPALQIAGRQTVDAYYRARFGGVPLPPEAIAKLEADLLRAESAR